jgi:hypothetical protein
MTDQNRVNSLLQALFSSTSTGGGLTPEAGSGGGSGFAISPPYHLRLMTTVGSNTAYGTEANGSNCPGYTVLGATLGTQFCAAPSAGAQSNTNQVLWNATGTWATVGGLEVWDNAATPLRWLQGPLSSPITGAVNGDSIIVAAGALTLNAGSW